MGRMCRVAQQYNIIMAPRRIADRCEVDPFGVIGYEPVACQLIGKNVSKFRHGLFIGNARCKMHIFGVVKTGTAPDVFTHFHDECRTLIGEWVAMYLHDTVLRFLDKKLESLENLISTQPYEFI